MTTKNSKGFTLIEMLVVMAIVGVLTSATLTLISTARTKAQAANIARSLQEIEKGLNFWGVDENWRDWPLDASLTLANTGPNSNNKWIDADFLANYGLGELFSIPPTLPNGTNYYIYDNDGDTRTNIGSNCPGATGQWERGVNILILGTYLNDGVAHTLNQLIDGDEGDPEVVEGSEYCGKIRYGGTSTNVLYLLDPTPDF